MMHANTINRDQAETGSAGAIRTLARQFGGQRCCQPASDHHQFKPEHLPSLLASGRSLRGGCVARRQTGARAGAIALIHNPAIRSTRLHEISELRRVGLSGADARAASFNLQCTEQPAVQAFADLVPRIHSSEFLSSSTNASTDTQKRRHGLAKLSQELVKLGQGGGYRD